MSNSRIMLTCRHCGKQMVLGKGWDGDYLTTHPDTKGYELNEFFTKHSQGKCAEDLDDYAFVDNATAHFCILEEGDDVTPYLYNNEYVTNEENNFNNSTPSTSCFKRFISKMKEWLNKFY